MIAWQEIYLTRIFNMTDVLIQTSKGDIKLRLNPKAAPKTVQNFIDYANQGFYENTIFHRVIPGFMIQGGGMDCEFNEKITKDPVDNEAYLDTKIANKRGTIAMARTMIPDSATSQFFINLKDNDFLNFTSKTPQGYGYCAFGEVIEGLDIVDTIATATTGNHGMHQDVPVENIVIHNISVMDLDEEAENTVNQENHLHL